MSNQKLYAEVLGVLMALGNKYIDKTPKEIIHYLTQNCDMYSIPEIDKNKRIEDQNISDDAKAFLTMLRIKYWCKTEREKEELLNLLNENEVEYQRELQEKYSVDNLFKCEKTENVVKEEIPQIAVEKYKNRNIFRNFFSIFMKKNK